MEITNILVFFICWTTFGCLCSYFGTKRGRNPYIWFFIGFFLGIIGLAALFILPKITEEHSPKEPVKKELSNEEFQRKELLNKLSGQKKPLLLWYFLDKDHHQHGPYNEIFS